METVGSRLPFLPVLSVRSRAEWESALARGRSALSHGGQAAPRFLLGTHGDCPQLEALGRLRFRNSPVAPASGVGSTAASSVHVGSPGSQLDAHRSSY